MSALRDVRHRYNRDRVVLAILLALTVFATAIRLYQLGARVFYFDEAWFGYWILQVMERGDWTYRPILHGPFYTRVNSVVFALLGANDWTARLVPALMGGGLPLAAWLYRTRLKRAEVVALGTILAINPILLYYSRFMRKDLPLAALMFVTLGLLIRASDTGQRRYAYGAAFSLGWAFTTKESVLLWILTWAGAALLVLDRRLLVARAEAGDGPRGVLATLGQRARTSLSYWGRTVLGAAATFFVVVIYAYAPRAGVTREVGLWQALTGGFGQLPEIVTAATVGAARKALDYWISGGIQGHPYLPYFQDTARTLIVGALGVCLLGTIGFLWDRYGREVPRDLVGFHAYAGLAAIVGYPLANNLPVPWSTTHAVVPLAIPAAVGAVVVLRPVSRVLTAEGTRTEGERVLRAMLAVILIGSLVVNAGLVGLQSSYLAPHESPRGDPGSEVIYYAQPPAELRTPIDAIYGAADPGRDGPDVLYVGDPLTNPFPPPSELPATASWHLETPLILGRIPFPWYTQAAGAEVKDVATAAGIGPSPPPVVIATPDRRDAVAATLGTSYEGTRYELDDIGDRVVVVFVDQSRLRG
ncbi:MAG: flippase activity-associated protein Agl23 [Halobacteriaceae archaeon]